MRLGLDEGGVVKYSVSFASINTCIRVFKLDHKRVFENC